MKLIASSNLSKLNCVIEGTENKGSLYFSNIVTALDKSLISGIHSIMQAKKSKPSSPSQKDTTFPTPKNKSPTTSTSQ